MFRFSPVFYRRSSLLIVSFMSLLPGTLSAQNFGEMIRSSDPLSPEEELKTFTVPEGFEVQLFAAEPDIQKPMNLAFDARGRLWMSGSNDYPLPNFNEDAQDSIRILEDTDGDGRADKFTTFVEGITIPIGLYPYQDGVIAFSIPNITFFRDTVGDGKCDTREVLYGPFDHTRDTHGLNNAFRRGLDGWIYACHGFNNNSKVAGADGHEVAMQSGNTYRFRIDGSRIEQHTHGQVNPFGMTFDPKGDLYTSDCHTVPMTLLMRDGFYPSFGKPHDGLGFVPAVMTHLHGSTAIAGLSQYTGTQFPLEYRESFFVGNVMTSRVHRDIIEYTGSTAKAIEQADFMTSSDSWFRPVDTICGPDQTLYVADFYNRIIGHYEVPLDHPGRDRFRGRIWRVRYVGDHKSTEDQRPQDLTKLDGDQLAQLLRDENLPYAYRVVEQLVERIGQSAVAPVREILKESKNGLAQSHALWVLHRLNNLTSADLIEAMASDQEIVRIHTHRILEQIEKWSDDELQGLETGLSDHSALVRRAAASAAGQHADVAPFNSLLDAWNQTEENDAHLRHALKIALRNSLKEPTAYDNLASNEFNQQQKKLIAELSLSVKTGPAAEYLLDVLDEISLSNQDLSDAATMAASYLSADQLPAFIGLVQNQFQNDLDQQLQLCQAMETGLRQQSQPYPKELTSWAADLTQQVLTFPDPGQTEWSFHSDAGGKSLQWDLEPRNTADGKRGVPFLSSLPAGERATGILRSKTFKLPRNLSFYVCGHLGFPQEEAIEKNRVSLFLSDEKRQIQTALAPRSDTATKIEWDLGEYAGQQGYLEVQDGLDIRAYAWIAISGIDPPIVRVPAVGFRTARTRMVSAISLAGRIGLSGYTDDIKEIARNSIMAGEVRYAALTYAAATTPEEHQVELLTLFAEAGISQRLQDQLAALILEFDKASFDGLLKSLPLRLQTVMARAMTQRPIDARRLLSMIEQGTISPRVLSSRVVERQIENLDDEELKKKFADIQTQLPPANEQIQQLIAARKAEFRAAIPSMETGIALFKKNCATCHSLQGEGKKIGPQLDGVGNRGLDRILEDVLAPNRNIDVAFRSRTYLLENGKVESGLFRRNEGELTVIANTKGEEISFSTSQIEAEKTAVISIMPENWGELIPPEEFPHLLGYLLQQRQASSEN